MIALSRRVPPLPTLAAKLESAYRGFGVVGHKLLLAVSGGADSTALLMGTSQIAAALELTLVVGSLDHGLRAEAELEVERVRGLASSLGLSFVSAKLALRAGPSLEGRARQARYQALEEMRSRAGCDWIATGHTASDQAETLLMRLLRGTALGGASGIRPTCGRLVRPMLACTRREVERFLSELGVDFVDDPMNSDPRFTRSRIRALLIPAVESVSGPAAISRLAAFASAAASDAVYLDQLAEAAFDRLLQSAGKLDAAGVRALAPPLQTRVLARLLLEAGASVDRAAVGRARAALSSAGRATLSRGFEIRSAGGTLRCIRAPRTPAQPAALSLSHGWVADSASGMWIGVAEQRPTHENGEWLEIGDAPLPLSIRRRRPGDRVGPARGARGTKLQDLMVDLGIPSEERDAIPVVCDAAGRILWVIGVWPRTRSFVADRQSPGAARYVLARRISPPASASRPRSL